MYHFTGKKLIVDSIIFHGSHENRIHIEFSESKMSKKIEHD